MFTRILIAAIVAVACLMVYTQAQARGSHLSAPHGSHAPWDARTGR
jgi:hypothetical protein